MLDTLTALHNRKTVISHEALSINRTTAPLLKKLVSYIDGASEFVNKQLNSMTTPRHELELDATARKAQLRSYADLRTMTIPVPAGLSVTWLQYLDVLEEAHRIVENLYDDTLRPFSLFVGACINDPERTTQLITSHSVTVTDLGPIKKKFSAALSNGTKAEQQYGKCIQRHTDWTAVRDRTNALINSSKKLPKDLISESISQIDEQLTLLVQKMSDTNNQFRPTPAIIEELSDLTYMLAEKVTFYATYVTYYNAYIVAMAEASKVIDEKA